MMPAYGDRYRQTYYEPSPLECKKCGALVCNWVRHDEWHQHIAERADRYIPPPVYRGSAYTIKRDCVKEDCKMCLPDDPRSWNHG